MKYNIILDEKKLDDFIKFLPDITDTEVYYLSLFGRHKYCKEFPNMRDDGQLARFIARKDELKEKILRLESPIGSYIRNDMPVPQEALALYISLNPRSLTKANREMLVELARRIADGNLNFSPISLATTEIHRATDRKFFIDFDFDDVEPAEHLPKIREILPADCYRVLKTRGGFHLLVEIEKAAAQSNKKFYPMLAALPKCDVRGANNLTPVPGCTQGGFVPYFLEE